MESYPKTKYQPINVYDLDYYWGLGYYLGFNKERYVAPLQIISDFYQVNQLTSLLKLISREEKCNKTLVTLFLCHSVLPLTYSEILSGHRNLTKPGNFAVLAAIQGSLVSGKLSFSGILLEFLNNFT